MLSGRLSSTQNTASNGNGEISAPRGIRKEDDSKGEELLASSALRIQRRSWAPAQAQRTKRPPAACGTGSTTWCTQHAAGSPLHLSRGLLSGSARARAASPVQTPCGTTHGSSESHHPRQLLCWAPKAERQQDPPIGYLMADPREGITSWCGLGPGDG